LGFREPLEDRGLQDRSLLPVGIERYCDRVFEPDERTLVRSQGHADQTVRVTVKAGEARSLVVRLDPAE